MQSKLLVIPSSGSSPPGRVSFHHESVALSTLASAQLPFLGLPEALSKPLPGQKLAHHRLPIFPGKTLPSWGQALLSQDFELLCRDGSRADVTEWRRCHLARVPAHAVVVRADTDGGLMFRLLNDGQVSSGQPPHPTPYSFPDGTEPSCLSPGWEHGLEPSWGWASQAKRGRTQRPSPGPDHSWGGLCGVQPRCEGGTNCVSWQPERGEPGLGKRGGPAREADQGRRHRSEKAARVCGS